MDNDYVVKVYRKLETGINPEIEIGRFLTEVAGFANTPALLGSVELVEGNKTKRDRDRSCLCPKPGRRLDRDIGLSRSLRRRTASAGRRANIAAESEEQVPYLRYMSQTGRRVAEMHLALAGSDEFADFAPEPTEPEDVRRWIEDVIARAERVFEALGSGAIRIREADRLLVDQAAGAARRACVIA